jgi:hypothetical protein
MPAIIQSHAANVTAPAAQEVLRKMQARKAKLSSEPKGNHQRGKPLPIDSLRRLIRRFKLDGNMKAACRDAGVSRMTGYRKIYPERYLPELDI